MTRVTILLPLLLLAGCVSPLRVVTAPVRAVGKTVDLLTTSQAEADRKRGREMRKAEERAAKEARRRQREAKRAARED